MSILGLGACARHDQYAGHYRYGSLKDDIVTGSTERVAKAPVRKTKVVRESRIEPRQKETVASAAPAPAPAQAMKAPPPEVKRAVEPKPAEAEKPTSPPAAKTPIVAPATAKKPAAPEPPLPPVDEPAAVAEMLAEGLGLFEQGKVVQARRRFVAAMNGPVPEVLLALARSYDTYYLSRLPTSDGAPDMQRALVLYERALERGAKEAAPDLERTRGILKIPR
ncbi:MAG: hypothetical protein R3D44_02195 [Hyphomicrobiaceae bacterium]